MKQARTLLLLVLCCISSVALSAQCYSATGAGTIIPLEGDGGGDFLGTRQRFDFTIAEEGIVGQDVEIRGLQLFIDHTAVGDLLLILRNPAGAESMVSQGTGGPGSQGYAGYTYADTAPIPTEGSMTGTGPLTGSARPLFAFNTMFAGDEVRGTWSLIVYDRSAGDAGEFIAAELCIGALENPLPANEQQVNLAAIAEINVTLDDDCQALVIPEMVLTGDLDDDGDGTEVGMENFEVVVVDDDETNGGVIDGCGTYNYRVSARSAGFTTTQGFASDYDPGGANVLTLAGADAAIEFTETGVSLSSAGSGNTGDPSADDALLRLTFVNSGFVSMSFSTDLDLPAARPDITVIDFEGEVLYQLPAVTVDDQGLPQNGSLTDGGKISDVAVEAGNTLILSLVGSDEVAQRNSTFSIDNFLFVETPTEASFEVVNFAMSWGVVHAEDKTAPELIETPLSPSTLLCSDIDANHVNTLPSSISRCYMVNSVTGATILGSMAPELRAILAPNRFDENGSTMPALVPTFFDGCAGTLQVCVSDVMEASADGCGTSIITRTFTAGLDPSGDNCEPVNDEEEDAAATEASTSFQLTFLRPSIDSLVMDSIPAVVEIEACGSLNSPLEFLPTEADYPFLTYGDRTLSLFDADNECSMIAVTFSTSGNPIVTCPNTVKFQRTFTVVDWCDATNVQSYTQLVKIGDGTGPVITIPTPPLAPDGSTQEVLTYGTNVSGECAAAVRLDAPGVSALDDCSGATVDMRVTIYPDGDVTGIGFGAYAVDLSNASPELSDPIELGDYTFVYTATDECGNVSTSTVPFRVVDGSTPEAICEDGLNITLSQPTGLAVVTPSEIDGGSRDDCASEDDLIYQIGRSSALEVMPTEFADRVVFTCEDLGTQYLTLEVRDGSGPESNVNVCWLEVLVEVKNGEAAACMAPAAVTLTCDEFNAAFPAGTLETATAEELDTAFGVPASVGVCGASVTSAIISSDLNECGIGTATREFTLSDVSDTIGSDPCTQLITIVGVHEYQIVLPGDATSLECTGASDTGQIQVNGGSCDMVVIDAVTEEVASPDGADECYQVRTTYTITNLCEVDMASIGATPITRAGLDVENEDPIYLNVLSRNALDPSDDVAFLSSSDNREFTPNSDDDDQLVDYANSSNRGRFTYVQSVSVFDRVFPVIDATGPSACISGCTADVSLDFTATDDCITPTIALDLDANYNEATGFVAEQVDGVTLTLDDTGAADGNYTLNATNVPAGDHAIRVTATDGCGNASVVILPVSVCGDVAPIPMCLQAVTAELRDDGDGGGIAEVLAASFIPEEGLLDCFGNPVTKFGIVRAGDGPAAVDQVSLTVTCADFGDLVPVEVYAFSDQPDAEPEFCSVLIEVQEGSEVTCGEGGNLAGRVATNGNAGMSGVQITLSGANGTDKLDVTDAEGRFDFIRLPYGGDYTLTPNYGEPVNLRQVKISDIVAISGVILGNNDFETPYDYLAADVDQNQRLNVLDMVAIQRVVLGLDQVFNTQESWGFVPAGTSLADPYSATFPRVFNANDIQANVLNADFIAFEYGNVTGEGRTALDITTQDVRLTAGQTHTVVIDMAGMSAFQGTFQLGAGLELVGAEYGGRGALNLNHAAEGLVAAAVFSDEPLSLTVRATEAGQLSELLGLTDAITVREGVSGNGTPGSLSLTFGPPATRGPVNGLGEATPNPVVASTRIGYTLAVAGEVAISIRDLQGRTILVRKLSRTAGQNAEVVNVSDLKGATGVLTYTLETEGFTATRKMVVIH